MRRIYLIGISLALTACGSMTSTPGRFGDVTSAVVLVNPVINQESTDTGGLEAGPKQEDVAVEMGGLRPVYTDASGLALVEGFPTGEVELHLDGEGPLLVDVVQEKELYDIAVVLQEDGTVAHIFDPVRYRIGGEVTWVQNGSELRTAIQTPNSVVLLAPGVYEGNVNVSETGVLIFGSWDPVRGPLSIITGDVSMTGSGGRLRGVEIEGNLHVPGGDFSMAFSKVTSADINGNTVFLLRNIFTTSQVSVSGANTILVDNSGLD